MFSFKTKSLFGQTKQLEKEIDQFVDILSEVGLLFKSIVLAYLNSGITDKFDETVKQVSEMESRADKITKEVERTLYEETLIPDARSDVLRLLEHLDEIIGMYQGNCYHFSIQKPDFPKEFQDDLIKLSETVVSCVESLCLTVRSFFRDHSFVILSLSVTMPIKLLFMKKNPINNLLPLREKFLILSCLWTKKCIFVILLKKSTVFAIKQKI